MGKIVSAALLSLSFSGLSVFAGSDMERTRSAFFPDISEIGEIEVPPAKTPAPAYVPYDYSRLPSHIFTRKTDFTPVLLEAIRNTNYTLDAALYNINIPELSEALVKARDRGVKVRLIFDRGHVKPKWYGQMKYLRESEMNIRVMNGRMNSGSMHNKYAVFDGTVLRTGSANWTWHARDLNCENMVFAADPHIVKGYMENFEWMWEQSRSANAVDAQAPPIGPLPRDPSPSIVFNGEVFPKYAFSPGGETENLIVKAVDAAGKSIDVAMFVFTSQPVMDAISRAARRGVAVNLMLFSGQRFPYFETAVKLPNLTLKFADGRSERGLMHHKYAVIDGEFLIEGAFNWTRSAQERNAENTLFLTNPAYVEPFKDEFDELFEKAWAVE